MFKKLHGTKNNSGSSQLTEQNLFQVFKLGTGH